MAGHSPGQLQSGAVCPAVVLRPVVLLDEHHIHRVEAVWVGEKIPSLCTGHVNVLPARIALENERVGSLGMAVWCRL